MYKKLTYIRTTHHNTAVSHKEIVQVGGGGGGVDKLSGLLLWAANFNIPKMNLFSERRDLKDLKRKERLYLLFLHVADSKYIYFFFSAPGGFKCSQ